MSISRPIVYFPQSQNLTACMISSVSNRNCYNPCFCLLEMTLRYPCGFAIWANPAEVTTVMLPMHTGTRKRLNTLMPAGTTQILTTKKSGTHSHVHTPTDNKPGTEWFALGIHVYKKIMYHFQGLK